MKEPHSPRVCRQAEGKLPPIYKIREKVSVGTGSELPRPHAPGSRRPGASSSEGIAHLRSLDASRVVAPSLIPGPLGHLDALSKEPPPGPGGAGRLLCGQKAAPLVTTQSPGAHLFCSPANSPAASGTQRALTERFLTCLQPQRVSEFLCRCQSQEPVNVSFLAS